MPAPIARIRRLLEGARAATGATVVIDVFRAFSLVPWALARGAKMVVPVRTEAEARPVRERIRLDPTGGRFLDPALYWFPEADFDVCMDADRFDRPIVAAPDSVYGVRLEYAG